jgi:hypothetical protein
MELPKAKDIAMEVIMIKKMKYYFSLIRKINQLDKEIELRLSILKAIRRRTKLENKFSDVTCTFE